MSTVHDEIKRDLKDLMYNKQPGENEIRVRVSTTHDLNRHQHNSVARYSFSDQNQKKLSKIKSKYKVDKHGLVVSGIACILLATFALLVLPLQYSWIVAIGCFWPMIITAIKGKKYGRSNRRNKKNKHL